MRRMIYSYDKRDYETMKTMLNIDWKTALADMSTQEAMDKLDAIRRACRQFERKLAKECRTNNKGIWNYIRNRTNTRGGTGQLVKEDGTLTQDDREAAEVLNQHFFKTFTKEDSTNIPHVTPKNLTTETLTTFEITKDLVKKCLLQLKTDKSPGTDGISPRILKKMSEQLCVPLNIIFELSINTSTLPRQWRDAIICPIYTHSEKRNETQQTTGQCP